jgi:hypothetical protein
MLDLFSFPLDHFLLKVVILCHKSLETILQAFRKLISNHPKRFFTEKTLKLAHIKGFFLNNFILDPSRTFCLLLYQQRLSLGFLLRVSLCEMVSQACIPFHQERKKFLF